MRNQIDGLFSFCYCEQGTRYANIITIIKTTLINTMIVYTFNVASFPVNGISLPGAASSKMPTTPFFSRFEMKSTRQTILDADRLKDPVAARTRAFLVSVPTITSIVDDAARKP